MNRTTACVAMLGLATLVLSTTAGGQGSSARPPARAATRRVAPAKDPMKGFVLGVHTIAAPGLTVSGDDMDGQLRTGLGPGAGVMVGYGFNQTWTAFASLDLAKVGASAGDYSGSFGLSHFEVGARANLPHGSASNVPYLMASVGRRGLGARVTYDEEEEPFDLALTGGMLSLGGGIQHAMSPSVMLDGGLELGFGRFGHYDGEGESGSLEVNGTTTIRLRFGLTWRPGNRRTG